jgi:hypothetical protein
MLLPARLGNFYRFACRCSLIAFLVAVVLATRAAQFQPETGYPEGSINFASILHRSLATMQDDITND